MQCCVRSAEADRRSTIPADAMSITYCLHFDERYGVESLKKHRTVVQSRWARWTLKIVCGLDAAHIPLSTLPLTEAPAMGSLQGGANAVARALGGCSCN